MRTVCPRHRVVSVALALAVGVSLGCASIRTPSLASSWIRVETAHLEIWSEVSEEETLEIARELQFFAEVVRRVTGLQRVTSERPTRLFVFAEETWDELVESRATGLFTADARRNTLLMQADEEHAFMTRHVLFHEYVHFLVANQGNQDELPYWYNEGWAEFLGTVRQRGDVVTVGEAAVLRWQHLHAGLDWLDMGDVLRAERGPSGNNDVLMLYAQSWALVHYLRVGRDERRFFTDQFADYLAAVRSGEDDVEAFEVAFGIEVDALEPAIREHLADLRRIPYLEIPVRALPEPPPVRVTAAARGAVAEALGELETSLQDYRSASYYLAAALEADPTNARLRASYGVAEAYRGREQAGLEAVEEALAAEPEDARLHVDLARVLLAGVDYGNLEARPAGWDRANVAAKKALRLDPDSAEAHFFRGYFLLAERRPDEAIEHLERATNLLPGYVGARLYLARAYVRRGRVAEAERHLRGLESSAHNEDIEGAIATIRAEINDVAAGRAED
ncbi:MAG: tetratricopeptide repeat protein [Myxococcota bacterium]